MVSKKKEFVFSLLLILTAIVWGSTFVIVKDIQQTIAQGYILAIRFTIATLGLSYYVWQARHRIDRTMLTAGAVTGFLLFTAFMVQTYGLNYTTASKNAILSQTSVIFVPLLLWIMGRERITIKIIFTAFLCFLGILIISPPEASGINKGDLISLIGGFCYASHIVAVAIYSSKTEVMPMTCLQFGFAALFAWIAGLCTSPLPTTFTASIFASLAWLSIMATLVAMTLMNLGIKYVSSTKTTIILSMESLFGCMFGIIIHDDPLTWPICIGGAIVIGSILLAQLNQTTNEPTPDLART